jgi:hypothetical protein
MHEALAATSAIKGPKTEFRITRPSKGPALRFKLRTNQNQERIFTEERREFEQGQSSIIQDNQAVESRNLLDKSEGQPSKPTFTVRADVIAALNYPSGGEHELVNADGDDPLVKQETMGQLNCEEPKSVRRDG